MKRVNAVTVYVVNSPKYWDPCGFSDTAKAAYGELATSLMLDTHWVAVDLRDDAWVDRYCQVRDRLTRYLQWLDSKEA